MRTKCEDKLEALRAHKAALLRDADEARASGDKKTLQMTRLLLRQCDHLIERTERVSGHRPIMNFEDE